MTAIVVLFIVALIALAGIGGWTAIGLTATDGKRQKDLERNPDPTLTALFDGSPQVVYAPHTRHGLTTPTLVAAAAAHGYRMISERGNMAARQVIFERVTTAHS